MVAVGWVHRPHPAPHLHGCQLPKNVDILGMDSSTHWICPECETLWILHDYMRWWHWRRANWWQRWKYWNWTYRRRPI